jgi:hypothetical protein
VGSSEESEQGAAAKRSTRDDASIVVVVAVLPLFSTSELDSTAYLRYFHLTLSSSEGHSYSLSNATPGATPGADQGTGGREPKRESDGSETEKKKATQTRTLATAAAAAAVGCCWASTLEPATSATSATRRKARRAMMSSGVDGGKEGRMWGANLKRRLFLFFLSLSLPLSFLSP